MEEVEKLGFCDFGHIFYNRLVGRCGWHEDGDSSQNRLHTSGSHGKVSVSIAFIIALQGFEHAVCLPDPCNMVNDAVCDEIADCGDVGGGTFVGKFLCGQFAIHDLEDLKW